jgi:hypothetical protein
MYAYMDALERILALLQNDRPIGPAPLLTPMSNSGDAFTGSYHGNGNGSGDGHAGGGSRGGTAAPAPPAPPRPDPGTPSPRRPGDDWYGGEHR